MNVITTAQSYISRMISDTQGMKALLLDPYTTPFVSAIYTHSQLLANEVYLVDRVNNPNRDKLSHLKCICFVRPTLDSLQFLYAELKDPKYGDYYIYLSNVLRKMALEKLAEADVFQVVKEVHEYFLDYLAINPDLFSLDLDDASMWPLCQGSLINWHPNTLQRTVEGLSAVCLALKRRPIVRYAHNSPLAKRLAHEIKFATGSSTSEQGLFDTRSQGLSPALLLLVDRRSDLTTPLLAQWTYQAMVHEYIGIEHGLVDLSHIPDIKDDLKQVVLTCHDDAFYRANLCANFGDLGVAIKQYLDEYQSRTANPSKFESIADMKKFVDAYPEVRKLAGNVSKHVAITSELSRVVDLYNLLAVSEVEQNVVCDPNNQYDQVWVVLKDVSIPADWKLKLVMIYVLKYRPAAAVLQLFTNHLTACGVPAGHLALLSNLVLFEIPDPLLAGTTASGAASSFSGNTATTAISGEMILDRTRQLGKSVFRGLKGVENVYTQHVPKLHSIIDLAVKGKLKESVFPFVDGQTAADLGPTSRVSDLIVFVIGGTTYQEARFVSQFGNTPTRIVLGGHTVHNSQRSII